MGEKWNGKSIHQLNRKKQRIAALDTAIGELTQLRSEAEWNYLEELGQIIERNPADIAIGSWSCDGSPIRLCIYDLLTEERDDECLFCGQPNERK